MSRLGRLLERRVPPAPADQPSFVHIGPDGRVDLAVVNEAAALRCALSRLCAHCGESQGFPLVFAGPAAELRAGRARRPGMHEACARVAVEQFRAAGLLDVAWALHASGSFTVERPVRRTDGQPVGFRPGELLWAEEIPAQAG